MERKARRVVRLVLTLFVLAETATGTPFQQSRQKQDSTSEDDGILAAGFRLSASLDKQQFASGEPILLKVSLRNTTDHPLRILGTLFQLGYEIEVRNDRGELVSLTESGKRKEQTRGIDISLGYLYIERSKEWSENLEVSRLYDMATVGTYTIIVRRAIPGRGLNQPVAVSNTLRVKVMSDAEQIVGREPRERVSHEAFIN